MSEIIPFNGRKPDDRSPDHQGGDGTLPPDRQGGRVADMLNLYRLDVATYNAYPETADDEAYWRTLQKLVDLPVVDAHDARAVLDLIFIDGRDMFELEFDPTGPAGVLLVRLIKSLRDYLFETSLREAGIKPLR